MVNFCWAVTILFCIAAGITLGLGILGGNASSSAIVAIALVIVPYVFSKAVAASYGPKADPELKDILESIEDQMRGEKQEPRL